MFLVTDRSWSGRLLSLNLNSRWREIPRGFRSCTILNARDWLASDTQSARKTIRIKDQVLAGDIYWPKWLILVIAAKKCKLRARSDQSHAPRQSFGCEIEHWKRYVLGFG
eukprot:scaffold143_cov260-Pinguiococcus_pyrenoidosus.AAC.13